MTPLEFFIGVHNSDAKDALQEVQEKLDGFKKSTDDLYEGPAREMKIRTEIRGAIKDIAMGETPMYALINAAERMSEAFKFAGPISAALAVGFALNEQMRAAAKSAGELSDQIAKVAAVPLNDATMQQLKDLVKACDEALKKYGERGFMERLFMGSAEKGDADFLKSVQQDALQRIDAMQAAEIDAKTEAMKKLSDEDLAQANAVQAAKDEYAQKAAAARAQGDEQAAQAWERQMGVAIDNVNKKYADAREKRRQEHEKEMADLTEQYHRALAGGDPDKLQGLQDERGRVAGKMHDDIRDPQQYMRDAIELADLDKQITAEKKRLADEQAEKTKQAAEAQKSADEKTAELRREATKAQFDALSKEDQVIVMRAAAAALEQKLIADKKRGATDDVLRDQKELADVQKRLNDATRKENPWAHIQADEALRGAMSSGSFNRVSNDAADRAEKQRDQTNDYLKSLLGAIRGGTGDLDAF